jgi:Fic family protein
LYSYTDIVQKLAAVPSELVAVLARVEYGRGQEALFRTQAPQVLERLAVRTRFESIAASSAIEDVVVDDERAVQLVRDHGAVPAGSFRDRSEAELAGYRDATDELLARSPEPLTVRFLLHLHRLLMRHTGDPHAGHLKTSDNAIGDRRPDGSVTVVFKPVTAGPRTESHLAELVARYEQALADPALPRLLLVAALVLDFLAIHPFQDGNGRVARLLTTSELLRHGYGVARYVSIEQRIFESKHSYYAALRSSQASWHRGRHDLWPWTGYLLRILEDAYTDFADRVAAGIELTGLTKEEQVRAYVLTQAPRSFRLSQIADALPDISHATIRNALEGLRSDGQLDASRGRSATWTRLDGADSGSPTTVAPC